MTSRELKASAENLADTDIHFADPEKKGMSTFCGKPIPPAKTSPYQKRCNLRSMQRPSELAGDSRAAKIAAETAKKKITPLHYSQIVGQMLDGGWSDLSLDAGHSR
jgi:hypothetical protein